MNRGMFLMPEAPMVGTRDFGSSHWSCPIEEQNAVAAITAGLTRRKYPRAYIVGNGVGTLTQSLSGRCDEMISGDVLPAAVARVRALCSHLPHVSVRYADLTDHIPDGPFDLILLRNVGYALSPAELLKASLALAARLAYGGELLSFHEAACRVSAGRPGHAVHELMSANLPLERRSEFNPAYSLGIWVKR